MLSFVQTINQLGHVEEEHGKPEPINNDTEPINNSHDANDQPRNAE